MIWFLIWLLIVMPGAYSAFGGWGFIGSLALLALAFIPVDYEELFDAKAKR